MKRTLILVAGGLVAFLGGLVGIYLAMPMLAPDVVETTQRRLDSLEALAQTLPPESLIVLGDTTLSTDSLGLRDLVPSPAQEAVVASLRDSLSMARQALTDAETQQDALQAQIDRLTGRLDALTAQRQDAQQVGQTLSKLEDRELSAILAQLDMGVLESLFNNATERNRTRLLQAMPSEKAAVFVQRLVRPSGAAQPPPQPAASSDDPAENVAATSTN